MNEFLHNVPMTVNGHKPVKLVLKMDNLLYSPSVTVTGHGQPVMLALQMANLLHNRGAGIAQWLERRTRD